MIRRPPRSTRADTLFPYTALFRSDTAAFKVGFGRTGTQLLRFAPDPQRCCRAFARSEEHTSELQSLLRTSYAVFCLKKKITPTLMAIFSTSKKINIHKKQHD